MIIGNHISKFCKSRVVPIIDKVGYVIDGWITVTNLSVYYSEAVDIEGEGLVDIEFVKKIQSKFKDLKVKVERSLTTITTESGEFKSDLGQDPEDFPHTPEIEDSKTTTFSQWDEVIDLSRFCSKDELRPQLTGIYFGDEYLVATDAHKMRWYPNETGIKDTPTTENFPTNHILPNLEVAVLKGMTDVEYNDTYVRFSNETQEITYRWIEARYPAYRAVIPQMKDCTIKVHLKDPRKIIAAALVTANLTTKQVVLKAEGKTIKLQSEDLDLAKQFEGELEGTHEGDDIRIGYNGEFLNMCINGDVTLHMSAPNRATLVDDNTLIMPVMLVE